MNSKQKLLYFCTTIIIVLFFWFIIAIASVLLGELIGIKPGLVILGILSLLSIKWASKITTKLAANRSKDKSDQNNLQDFSTSKSKNKRFWKTTFLLTCIIAGLYLLSTSFKNHQPSEAEWIEFKSPDNKFKIEFPSTPSQHILGDEDVKEYHAGSHPSYSILSMKLPVIINEETDNKTIELLLESVAENMNGTTDSIEIGSKKITSFKGRLALDYDLNIDSLYIRGKALLVDNTGFLIIVSGKESELDTFERFVNTFEIL